MFRRDVKVHFNTEKFSHLLAMRGSSNHYAMYTYPLSLLGNFAMICLGAYFTSILFHDHNPLVMPKKYSLRDKALDVKAFFSDQVV